MPLEVDFKLEGLEELQAQLAELGAIQARRTLAKAVRNALKPVLEEMQARVPVDTGALRDALKIRVMKPKGGEAVIIAGIRIAKEPGGGGSEGHPRRSADWRWHFIEFGTSTQPMQPFIRPAFEGNTRAMTQAIKDEVVKDIARVLRKRAKKGKR